MTVTYHTDLIQGSEEWHQARCGLITASEVKLLLTPATLKLAANDKQRAHIWELAAQRISKHVEPTYIGDEMLRGYEDEVKARDLYRKHFAPVTDCGFVTNDKFGFTLGCSPDGLVGDDGGLQIKSRRQKFQVETLCQWFKDHTIPIDFVLQVQSELLVTERKWWDFLSYSGGLPLIPMRAYPDDKIHAAIVEACAKTEARISEAMANWRAAIKSEPKLIPTEREERQEMFV